MCFLSEPFVSGKCLQVYLVRGNHEFRDMSENMGELGFLSSPQDPFFHRNQPLGFKKKTAVGGSKGPISVSSRGIIVSHA